MKATLAWGVALLTACGGGSGQSPEPARAESAQPTEAAGDVAGEETSGVRYAIEPCGELTSSEPLDLEDPEVASWVAMAQGHHEQTLGWRRLVLSDEVAGFAEHTNVSIDVKVLGGRDARFASGHTADGEPAECGAIRARELELEITLATADGAVATTFRSWFEAGVTNAGGVALGYGYNTVELNGSLELRPVPALDGTPRVGVSLMFSADSVRGSLSPGLHPQDDAWNRSSWLPIEAYFPDDPCGSNERSMGLDEVHEYLGRTPRASYARFTTSGWRRPMPAVWRSSPSNVQPSPEDVPLDVPAPTTISLTAGEPIRACAASTSIIVHAPVTVTTADGLVRFTQPFAFNVSESGAYIGERTPWVPAADFNATMGLGGLNLESGYGSISFDNTLNALSRLVEGSIAVSQWDTFRDGRVLYPVLEWCNAALCYPETE